MVGKFSSCRIYKRISFLRKKIVDERNPRCAVAVGGGFLTYTMANKGE
jgi:hypothetical protein